MGDRQPEASRFRGLSMPDSPHHTLAVELESFRAEMELPWLVLAEHGTAPPSMELTTLVVAGHAGLPTNDPGLVLDFPSVISPTVFTRETPESRFPEGLLPGHLQSCLVLPAPWGDKTRLALIAGSSRPDGFGPELIRDLERALGVLQPGIHHLRNFLRHTRQMQILEFAHEVIADLTSVQGIRPAAAQLSARLGEFAQLDQVAVYIADEAPQWLTCEAVWTHDRDGIEEWGLLPALSIASSPWLERLARGEASRIVDPVELLDLPPSTYQALDLSRIGDLLIIPLRAGHRFVGLVLGKQEAGRPSFPVYDADSWPQFGAQIGWVIETLRRLDARELGVRQFEGMLEMSQAIASSPDLRSIPELVTRRAMDLCEADEATLFLIEEDGQHLRGAYSVGEYSAEVLSLRVPLGAGITGTVAASRMGEIVNHAERDPRSQQVPGTPLDPEAILAAPLVSADRLVGVLTLHKLEGRTFNPQDLGSVEIFCTQAAVSMESARQLSARLEERTRLLGMVQSMHEGVVFADRERRVLLLNEAARTLLNLEARDWTGAPLQSLLGRSETAQIQEVLDRVRNSAGGSETVEIMLGSEIIMCSVSRLMSEDAGAGEVLLFHNVSDLKEIEAQVLQSSKMSAVGQLAAGVAHEFNNLIAAIYGYAQFMKENQSPEIVNKGVDVILRSSERAKELTSSLLTFSRRKPGRREPVSLNRILHDVLLLLNREFEKSRIRVHMEVPEYPATVADAGQLQQVVLNILINALQAMEDGGNLWVRGERADELLTLTIEDDGPGIPESHINRVFEPFFTTKGSLSGSAMSGSGLGLSAAYNIVKDHGGTLRVVSQPGKGAAFHITLPVRRHLAIPEEPIKPMPQSLRGVGRILVASEEAHFARSVADALGSLDHQVEICENREDLLTAAARADLVFLPLSFAGSDQIGFVRRLREDRARLPLVFFTERSAQETIEVEGDPWVFRMGRPFRTRDLVAMTSRILALRFQRAS